VASFSAPRHWSLVSVDFQAVPADSRCHKTPAKDRRNRRHDDYGLFFTQYHLIAAAGSPCELRPQPGVVLKGDPPIVSTAIWWTPGPIRALPHGYRQVMPRRMI
jgi:hypothetical protein